MDGINKICNECLNADIAECDHAEICPFIIESKCIKGGIVDSEYGIFADTSVADIIKTLINKVKVLESQIK